MTPPGRPTTSACRCGYWARGYEGEAVVVYGHTPVREPEWVNGTLCVDTGCVFGGALTALRWPERGIVSVPAERDLRAPARPSCLPGPGADRETGHA